MQQNNAKKPQSIKTAGRQTVVPPDIHLTSYLDKPHVISSNRKVTRYLEITVQPLKTDS